MALAFALLGGAGGRVRNVLNGTNIGHPLHPAVATVPVGAWTAALALDVVDMLSPRPAGYRDATRLTVGVGVAGRAAAALTGLADWQYTHDETRRAGLVHGIINTAALGLCAVSWRDRRRDQHGRARLCSGLGYGLTVASSFLGGNLVYRHQIGVDHSTNELGPADFVPVLPASDLEEGQPHHVVADGVGMILVRDDTTIHALGERCPHLGGPDGRRVALPR